MGRCLKITSDKIKKFVYDEKLSVENMMETLIKRGIVLTAIPTDSQNEIVWFEDIIAASMWFPFLGNEHQISLPSNALYFNLYRAAAIYGEDFINEIKKYVVVKKLREVVDYFELVKKNDFELFKSKFVEVKYLKNIDLSKRINEYKEIIESEEIDSSLRIEHPYNKRSENGGFFMSEQEYEMEIFMKKAKIGGLRFWIKCFITDYDCCCKGCYRTRMENGFIQ